MQTPRQTPRSAPPPASRLFRNPRLLWRTLLKNGVDGVPAASEDGRRLFVPAGGALHCLDANGRVVWATETATVRQQNGPVLDDAGRVYIGGDRGALLALDQRTGRVVWRFSPPASPNNAFLSRPAAANGRVLAEGSDNTVYALNATGGTLQWKFVRPDGSLGYSDPLTRPGALYVCGESFLYRLDAATGRERWRARMGGRALAGPAEGGGRVFTAGDGAPLSAFDAASGRPLWTFDGTPGGDWFGAPLHAAGTVYVGTYQRSVHAVDALSGKPKWSARLLGPALAAPVLDAGRRVLYVGSETFRNNPTLWALDAASGAVLFNYRAGSLPFSPVVAGDRLYAGALDGGLHAFAL